MSKLLLHYLKKFICSVIDQKGVDLSIEMYQEVQQFWKDFCQNVVQPLAQVVKPLKIRT